jgi:uncharacterized caspase-like protein
MKPRGWTCVFAALLAASLCASGARAEDRVALVIGNSRYEHLPVLDSPRKDAAAVAAKLQRLGFTVITGLDLDRAATEERLQQFQQALASADTALFYYAGHGLASSGESYLVPIDAELTESTGLDRPLLSLSALLSRIERGPRVGLIFIDASRDDPLPGALPPSSGGSGAPTDPPSAQLVVSFATAPGSTAAHGQGDAHSPFTAALLQFMDAPGRSIQDVLAQVRRTVVQSTGGQQVPWEASSLDRSFFLAVP